MEHRNGYYYNGYYYPMIVDNRGIPISLMNIAREYFNRNITIHYIPLLERYGIFRLESPGFIRKALKGAFYGNGFDKEYILLLTLRTLVNGNKILEYLKNNNPWKYKSFEQYYNAIKYQREIIEQKKEAKRREITANIGKNVYNYLKKNDYQCDNYLNAISDKGKFYNAIKEQNLN